MPLTAQQLLAQRRAKHVRQVPMAAQARPMTMPSAFADWQRRRQKLGDAAVGRQGEDHVAQGKRIAHELALCLGEGFWAHGLDYGCGWGRFSEQIGRHCGHLWVADIFEDWATRAACQPHMTPVMVATPRLPLDTGSMSLVVDIMTLQSVAPAQRAACVAELRRVTAPGARFVVLHRAQGLEPSQLASQLHLIDWRVTTVDVIDQSGELYYFLVGDRAPD